MFDRLKDDELAELVTYTVKKRGLYTRGMFSEFTRAVRLRAAMAELKEFSGEHPVVWRALVRLYTDPEKIRERRAQAAEQVRH